MAVFLLFGGCISALCWLVAAHLLPLCAERFGSPVNWFVIVLVYVVMACLGSIIAMSVLVGIGFLTPPRAIAAFRDSLKVAIVVTLIIGIVITMYETMHARLEAATLALRTKERDEADTRRLAAEAQLASLESRVQPHFL